VLLTFRRRLLPLNSPPARSLPLFFSMTPRLSRLNPCMCHLFLLQTPACLTSHRFSRLSRWSGSCAFSGHRHMKTPVPPIALAALLTLLLAAPEVSPCLAPSFFLPSLLLTSLLIRRLGFSPLFCLQLGPTPTLCKPCAVSSKERPPFPSLTPGPAPSRADPGIPLTRPQALFISPDLSLLSVRRPPRRILTLLPHTLMPSTAVFCFLDVYCPTTFSVLLFASR